MTDWQSMQIDMSVYPNYGKFDMKNLSLQIFKLTPA